MCVSGDTYKAYACLRVRVPMCVSAQRNTCVGKSRGELCACMAVPTGHADAACLCEREHEKRAGGTSAYGSRSMISVRVGNTHLHR